MSTMHYQTHLSLKVCSLGFFTIMISLSFSVDKMHNEVYLKLKCQHACTKPNMPSSSPYNILNKNVNIHRYGANRRQLEGHLYYPNISNYFINDYRGLFLVRKNVSSIYLPLDSNNRGSTVFYLIKVYGI